MHPVQPRKSTVYIRTMATGVRHQWWDLEGGTPDTNMLEVECFCHATLGRSREFVSLSEARCSRTRLVLFRYWGEDYENANYVPRVMAVPEELRSGSRVAPMLPRIPVHMRLVQGDPAGTCG